MTDGWTTGTARLHARIARLRAGNPTLPRLRIAGAIAGSRKDMADPLEAAAVLADAALVEGWIVILSPTGSRVAPFGAAGPPPGPVAEGEARGADGSCWRIGPGGSGLSIWRWQEDAPGIDPAGFHSIGLIDDALVERRRLLSRRADLGGLAYDIVWQRTDGFGLRPRLSLFIGFDDGSGRIDP